MKKTPLKSTVMLILTAAIWGFAFVAQSVAADTLGAFTFNGVRFILGAVSLIPIICIFERKDNSSAVFKRTVITGIITGTILCTASGLQQLGIVITGNASKTAFITSLYSIFVPIFLIFMGKKTSLTMWIGVICALVGLYLINVADISGFSLGDIIVLIGAVVWAWHVIAIDKFVGGVKPIQYSAVQFLTCGIESLIIAFMFEDVAMAPIIGAALPILYGGIMSAGVAYTFQVLGQRDADPTYAAIIFATEPIFAAIGEALILGKLLTPIAYMGCGIIFASVIISQFGGKKQQ
ncbi:MAG: DMT family transporter [Clostridia bacterium]|nr:DMT family transporter [Clostridia bacterium]